MRKEYKKLLEQTVGMQKKLMEVTVSIQETYGSGSQSTRNYWKWQSVYKKLLEVTVSIQESTGRVTQPAYVHTHIQLGTQSHWK